ncbi:MAG: ribbon-helix-helix domain-containing protein [Micrococcales bacterium]|nr:ribbon-helix-helix domain-containing protein [Micrococcales bacterium]
MSDYTTADGTRFTDEDIERWAAVDESEAGYTGGHLGPPISGLPTAGRPISVGQDARPFTVRLDAQRRARLDAVARARRTTASELVRELIDKELSGV